MRFAARVPPSRGHGGRSELRGSRVFCRVVHGKGPKRRIPADSNFFSLIFSVVFFSYSGLFAEGLFITSFVGECSAVRQSNNSASLGVLPNIHALLLRRSNSLYLGSLLPCQTCPAWTKAENCRG
ncbi:hypothetical protein HDV63DRAFT_390327 [Trichoderma sp. SZMC 28014]